jgi:cathepsin L
MVKVFLLLAAAALASAEIDFRGEFTRFQSDFGKVYSTAAERSERFGIFSANLREFKRHNESGQKWKKGVTKFADLTDEEFKSKYLGGYVRNPSPTFAPKKKTDFDPSALPTSIDYRKIGAVTPAKDQGSCGSCWAFATVATVESYVAMAEGGTLMEMSTQQVTSCSPNELQCGGLGGCQGSISGLAFTYMQLFGLSLAEDYPYVSGFTGDTGVCFAPPPSPVATIRGYEVLPRNDYAATMEHLATVGTLSVSLYADRGWSSYVSGVYEGCPYDEDIVINHVVQLVGYGSDPKLGDYWIIRNSWGEGWGEDHGFMRIAREPEMLCGTDETPLFGTGCVDDGVPIQTVCGRCGMLYDVAYPVGAMPI